MLSAFLYSSKLCILHTQLLCTPPVGFTIHGNGGRSFSVIVLASSISNFLYCTIVSGYCFHMISLCRYLFKKMPGLSVTFCHNIALILLVKSISCSSNVFMKIFHDND